MTSVLLVLWVHVHVLTLFSFIPYGTNAYHDQQDADDIIIKLKPGGTSDDIDNILSKHPRFKLGRQFDLLGETYYELVLDKNTMPRRLVSGNIKPLSDDDEDVVSIIQDPKVEKCMVDYKHPAEIMTTDPELDYVWYLTNQPDVKVSMNINKAWRKGYTGKGVTIAVIDTQTQIDHQDLIENIDAANSINLFDPKTNQEMEDDRVLHGTAVSGIIGASRSNDFCSAGISYKATILAVGIFPASSAYISTANTVSALTHNLSAVDIYSNSWGDNTAFGFDQAEPLYLAALEHGVTNGRQGKGSIYLFAAGNSGPESNTATSQYNSNIYTLVISSVEYDTVVGYGQVGSNIIAVGYGGSFKHKLIPFLYPIDKCSDAFGIAGIAGTSFSTPQVTGIIALALEANPDLTWRDVQHLIVRSSRRYHFKDKYYPGYKWRRNGFGFFFHPKMGFGLIDALKMVTKAKRWKTVPEMISCNLNAQNITRTAGNRKYLTGSLRVTRRDCSIRFLENIMVSTDVTYSIFRGYTEIELVSPKGTRSPLLTKRSNDNDYSPGTFVWKFRSVHFWGENTIGNWKLRTRSLSNYGQVGPVSWSVTFYGTAKRSK